MDINNMVLNWYIEEAGTKSSHLFHRLFISLNMLNVLKELIYINVYVLFCIKQQQFVEGLRG